WTSAGAWQSRWSLPRSRDQRLSRMLRDRTPSDLPETARATGDRGLTLPRRGRTAPRHQTVKRRDDMRRSVHLLTATLATAAVLGGAPAVEASVPVKKAPPSFGTTIKEG